MSLAMPVTPNNCLHPTVLATSKAAPVAWWRRTLRGSVAAAVIGAVTLAGAAGIEVARAWTSGPRAGAEATQVVGGVLVALFVVAAVGMAARARAMTGVIVASGFALFAHGGTLVLEGEVIGALFLGLAPVLAVLSNVAFAPSSVPQRDPAAGARLLALWMKTSRRKTAPGARRAASPTPLAMRASQATIIDVWVKKPSSSSSGSATPRSCVSSA
jgi:hypothetical protein